MISIKKGVLKISYEKEEAVKLFYEFCFAVNLIAIFALNEVKMASTATGVLLFGASIFILIGNKKKNVIIPYNAIWYLLLIIYAALSSIWASFVSADFISSLLRMTVVFLTAMSVAIYVDTLDDLERLITIFIISTAVIITLEIQGVSKERLFAGLMGGTFSGYNVNEVAFWVFCAEMMAFYKFYIKQQRVFLLFVLYFLFFVVLSSSRKAMVSAVIGPVAVIFFSTYKKNYIIKLILVLLLAVGVFYFIMTNETAYQIIGRRFSSMLEYFDTNTQDADNSLYMRNYYAEAAKKMFFESPIVGKGLGNFMQVVNTSFGATKAYSHSNYWQLLSEFGLIGFVMYYSFYVLCLIRLIKNAVKNKSGLSAVFALLLLIITAIESGFVTYNVKPIQIVLAIIYAGSYVGTDDGRKYKYIENNINKMEE